MPEVESSLPLASLKLEGGGRIRVEEGSGVGAVDTRLLFPHRFPSLVTHIPTIENDTKINQS